MLKLMLLATAAAAAAFTAAQATKSTTAPKCGNAEFMPPSETPHWNRPDLDEPTAAHYGMDYMYV